MLRIQKLKMVKTGSAAYPQPVKSGWTVKYVGIDD